MKLLKDLFIVLAILSIISACNNSQRADSRDEANTFESISSIYIAPLEIPSVDQSEVDLEKIILLEKIGEIKEGFSTEEDSFFAQITDLCIDKNNNLYVADSKLHKIFKFNKNREYITSFGREGQGPGEFTGRLRISAGNNGNIYVSDHGNNRFCVFSSNGELIRQQPLPKNTYDCAVANSVGNTFLLSKDGFNVIDCFDSEYKYLDSFIEMKYHLNFPFGYPPERIFKNLLLRPPISGEVLKTMSKNDDLFVVFNNSLIVMCYDRTNKLIAQFRIEHPRIIDDLKNSLNNAKRNGGWIDPVGATFFDNNGAICFCYYNNNLSLPEIYRYEKNGLFIDTLRVKDSNARSNQIVEACDSAGNFFGIDGSISEISIYKKERL
ncbi:MAG: 6-bladed beta-propeller [Nanoarchaeota archaeon]|nr:6-bladed beta-propeller [Nanoarchaeota archaeon]